MSSSLTVSAIRAKTPTPDSAVRMPDPADLLAWYDRHARVLPWRVGPAARRRGERPDAYRVWLSEIMLQQTTVKAVAAYFEKFVARWPRLEDLAAAEDGDVMAAWAGLGYYSRARNLLACARLLRSRHGGSFPGSAADLQQLPGIGPYTSAAIAALAFGEQVPVVDGNVERVVARLFAIRTPLPQAKNAIRTALAPLVPADRPGEFAEATMDLGATICTPKRPACALCPWNKACRAHASGEEELFPVKPGRKERPTRTGIAYVARRADGAVLLRRRPPKGLLGGMTEVPGTEWIDPPSSIGEPPLVGNWRRHASPVEHVFTHFRLLLEVWSAEFKPAVAAPAGHWWSPPGQLAGEALPSLMRKVIEAGVAPPPVPASLRRP